MTRTDLAVLAAAFLFSIPVFSADQDTELQIKPQKIVEGLHVLYGGNGLGASVGVVETSEGLVLIDAMKDSSAAKLAEALQAISERPVSHLFNTHGHEDHVSGNSAFVDKGAVLIRQANARDAGESKQIRFEEKLELDIGGVRFEAFAIQSHTPDDILIWLPEANVIFLGDTFTTRWHPTFYSGGEDGQLAVIDKVLELADGQTVIVPGHGLAGNRDSLLLYKSVFSTWMERMRYMAMTGASVEQMEKDSFLRETARLFLQDGSRDELPDPAYRRFIERTISTELMKVDKDTLAQLADYAGDYRYEDGMALRIEQADGGVRVYEGRNFSGLAIPLSKTHFHFPGRLAGEGHLTFQFDGGGNVTGATYVGESESWPAARVRD